MKIVIHCQMDMVGTDSWEFYEVDDNALVEELDDMAYDLALANAEMYGVYPPHDGMTEEEEEETDDMISGHWVKYVPELHDKYTMGGTPNWQGA